MPWKRWRKGLARSAGGKQMDHGPLALILKNRVSMLYKSGVTPPDELNQTGGRAFEEVPGGVVPQNSMDWHFILADGAVPCIHTHYCNCAC